MLGGVQAAETASTAIAGKNTKKDAAAAGVVGQEEEEEEDGEENGGQGQGEDDPVEVLARLHQVIIGMVG